MSEQVLTTSSSKRAHEQFMQRENQQVLRLDFEKILFPVQKLNRKNLLTVTSKDGKRGHWTGVEHLNISKLSLCMV